MNILHVIPHMGGGVGQVLKNVALNNKDKNIIHSFLILDKPQNTYYINICKDQGFEIIEYDWIIDLKDILINVDIVQIEWWANPLILKFLYYIKEFKIRLVFWFHISGCTYPYIHEDIAMLGEKNIFTTPYSFENDLWTKDKQEKIKKKSIIFTACPNIDTLVKLNLTYHDGFNIGYVGWLDYFKLHKNFIKMCSNVSIEDSKFIMVGEGVDSDNIKKQVIKEGLNNKFEFTGYSNNVQDELARFDVFAYPLQPNHTGTMEQVILEAMAVGLPCVLFNQAAEKYLIEDMDTGILVNNEEEYVNAIRYLYNNKSERERIGKNAKKAVINNFNLNGNIEKINISYYEVLKKEKKIYKIEEVFGSRPYEWFLKCAGSLSNNFLNDKIPDKIPYNYTVSRRSSVIHFADVFKDDERLQRWGNNIKGVRDNG